MISIRQEDHDSLRFLWVDTLEGKEPNVIVLRFTRVVFGVSSSPFLLNATLRQHLDKFFVAYHNHCMSMTWYVGQEV